MKYKTALIFFAVVFSLFIVINMIGSTGGGFRSDAMTQAESAAFGYELPLTTTEHWEDHVIEWTDPGMVAAIRQLLKKPEGDILRSEIWDISVLDIGCNSADGTGYIKANTITGSVTYELSEDTPWIEGLQDLVHFDSLKQLIVSDMSLSDSPAKQVSLAGLSRCQNLRHLTLGGLEVTDPEEISACTELLALELSGVTLESLELLRPLHSLEYLRVSGCPALDLMPLAELSRLKTLILSGSEVLSLDPLTQLPALKNLKLDNGAMYPSLEPLADTRLEYLSLSAGRLRLRTEVYDHLDYTPLTKIPTLISLDLENHRNVDADLCSAIMENAPGLLYLRVDQTPAAHDFKAPKQLIYFGNAY